MREVVDAERVWAFMRELGSDVHDAGTIYLTGGATAVLFGWRSSTIDIDIKIVPENDAVLRALPQLKERLSINVELASPAEFIPELPGWEDRGPYVGTAGRLVFRHYDLVSQALAKIERGHTQDRRDVAEMLGRGLVTKPALRERFERITSLLYRFPAIDPASFARSLEDSLGFGS